MPPVPGKALLFDIDGTLADTDALHLEAFNQILGPRGHTFDHARFTRELQGFSNASIGGDGPPYYPMARAIAGGLVFSTLVSLLVLPTIYALLDDMSLWSKRLLRSARAPRLPASATG